MLLREYNFPKTIALVQEKHIKLYLKNCKIIETLSGTLLLVSPIFGQGIYGRFSSHGTFWPSKICTEEMIAQLQSVEERGLEAVREIGLLTGNCCICGRTLTAEESISEGIGPICAGKAFGVTRPKKAEVSKLVLNLFD